jgi:nucleoside-diphosphate-sugar epimerase
MRVLIVGCGYSGIPLGAELVRRGHQVWGLRRSTTAIPAGSGMVPLSADITNPKEIESLPGPFDWVVNTVSSGGGDAADYERVYLQGTRNLVAALAPLGIKKYLHISSTSVYGQNDGSLVKESSPAEPLTETGKVLLATESDLLEAFTGAGFPVVILRLAGIYGPGRTRLLPKYMRNEARIPGKGEGLLNMIHLEDVVGVAFAALKSARPGEIYNGVDDEPVAEVHFFRWLSESLGKWMPPFEEADEAGVRKRGVTRKKVSNRKLKMELGYEFKHPTFRQGYTAEIRRLEQLGELNILPDPR